MGDLVGLQPSNGQLHRLLDRLNPRWKDGYLKQMLSVDGLFDVSLSGR